MRQYFAPTPASHDARSVKRISLEEEFIAIDNAHQAAKDIDEAQLELERFVDLKDALEDFAVITDGIENPTDNELQLADICSQMAVAGTDMNPDEFMQAALATEDFKSKVKQAWEMIVKITAKIWDGIEKFLRIHVVLPAIFARLKAAKEQIRNREDEPKYGADTKLTITEGLNYLTGAKGTIRDTANLVELVRGVQHAANMVYISNPKRVVNLGTQMARIINDWPAEDWENNDTDKMMSDLVKTLKEHTDRNSIEGFQFQFSGQEGEFRTQITQMFSDRTFFIMKTLATENTDTDLFMTLERFQRSGLSLFTSEEPLKTDEVSFTHQSASTYDKLLDLCMEIIQTLAQFNKPSGPMSEMRKVGKELSNACEAAMRDHEDAHRAVQAHQAGEGEEQENDGPLRYIEAVLKFNPSYVRWVQQPAIGYYTKVVGLMRVVLMITRHFNAQFEIKDQEREKKILAEIHQPA